MDDTATREFAGSYPTVSCMIGCAVIGAIVLVVAVPFGYWLLLMFAA